MKNEVKVDVNCNVVVTTEMAERCLVLLDWWQNDNPDKRIAGYTQDDGTVHFVIEDVEVNKNVEVDSDF